MLQANIYAILLEGLEHLWIWVWRRYPGTNPPENLKGPLDSQKSSSQIANASKWRHQTRERGKEKSHQCHAVNLSIDEKTEARLILFWGNLLFLSGKFQDVFIFLLFRHDFHLCSILLLCTLKLFLTSFFLTLLSLLN